MSFLWCPISNLMNSVTRVAGSLPISNLLTCSKVMGCSRGHVHMPNCSTIWGLIRHRMQPVSMTASTSTWDPVSGTVNVILKAKGQMTPLIIGSSLSVLPPRQGVGDLMVRLPSASLGTVGVSAACLMLHPLSRILFGVFLAPA